MNQTIVKRDVYQIVTDRMITLLEKGTVPWRQPWANAVPPRNLVSKKQYRGINVWLLASLNYADNLFLTPRQLTYAGGMVKEGEKPHIVVFWKTPEPVNKAEAEKAKEKRKPPLLRYYQVYNVMQCDGIPKQLLPAPPIEFQPLDRCDEIIEHMPLHPEVRVIEPKAYYHPGEDYINMPPSSSFDSIDSYYGTLFHELVHSTGHTKRLNRKELMEKTTFGSEQYSIEELTAELGACYLRSIAGISHTELENSAAYLQGWISKLKNDQKFIVYASAQAQKAVDFILNIVPEAIAETVSEGKSGIR